MLNEAKIGAVLVTGQPSDEELRGLRARGITTLVNVRLTNELLEPEGPKAEAAGLKYHEVPLNHQTITFGHVHRVADAIDAGDGGVLVHCHGGTRAAVVVGILMAERADEGASGAMRRIAEAGFDVAGSPYEEFIARYFAAAASAEK